MKKRIIKRISILVLMISILFSTSHLELMAAETARGTQWNYSYTGDVQTFTAPSTGEYYIEMYGASGGGANPVFGGTGGLTQGNITLKEGQTIYIFCGEQGKVGGAATFGGGGASSNNSASGGGATFITTTNRNELKNYKDYKEDIIAVAGGGGGASYNLENSINKGEYREKKDVIGNGGGTVSTMSKYYTYVFQAPAYYKVSNLSDGYQFGQGENGISGGGAGGGGYYGGVSIHIAEGGGVGGSGYFSEKVINALSTPTTHIGNGTCKIEYVGGINTKVSINLGSAGTIDGQKGTITLTQTAGTKLPLNIDLYDDVDFESWDVTMGDSYIENNVLCFGFETSTIDMKYVSPLTLEQNVDKNNRINLNYTQDDTHSKVYRVYQSYNLEDWWLAESGDSNINVKEFTQSFNYSGTVQSFYCPITTKYYLEIYGASGGYAIAQGSVSQGQGTGGKTTGYVTMPKGSNLYVAIGGKGGNGHQGTAGGGWNGGGYGTWDESYEEGSSYEASGGGGGATSITTTNRGVLKNFVNYKDEVIAVAGGGGGASYTFIAGDGGGTNGGANGTGKIATQTSGYAFGQGQNAYGVADSDGVGGAGGGWYGGYTENVSFKSGGGGGSGYIGGLFNATTTHSTHYGNGFATITYKDITSNSNTMNNVLMDDINAPNPVSDGIINIIDGKLQISWKDNGDNGTSYYHKVESYDKKTETLLKTSNIVKSQYTSGVKGYYWYIDTNKTGIVTKEHSYTENTFIKIDNPMKAVYFHVAAVDGAGNIGATKSVEVKRQFNLNFNYNKPSNASHDITGNEIASKKVTYQEKYGDLPNPKLEGWKFKGWYTSATGGTQVSKETIYEATVDSTVYAHWEQIKYTVRFNGNGNWNTSQGSYTQQFTYDLPATLTPNKFTRPDNTTYNSINYIKGYRFIGWGTSATQTTATYTDKQKVKNLKNTDGAVLDLYAIWKKPITLTFNFNGGKFNDSTANQVLNYTMYNSELSHTFDIKTYYGGFKNNRISVNKGINNKLTKTDTNGIQYRFLGYSLNPNATVPDSNFDVYNIKERTENYTIRDNTTLYAVWEPVLQMTVQLSAPQHSGVMQLTSDVPVTTTLGNFKISSGTRSTEIPSSATASVNSATIGTNVTNKDLVTYTVSAKGASNIKFSTAADSRILDIYTHGNNNTWFDKLNTTDKFEYAIDNFSNITSSFTIPQYIGTKKSYKTSNPESATGTSVYAIKFTCTQPSYYYSKYWNSPESTSVYGILFLNPTLPDDNTNVLPPYAVEDGAYEFETILN